MADMATGAPTSGAGTSTNVTPIGGGSGPSTGTGTPAAPASSVDTGKQGAEPGASSDTGEPTAAEIKRWTYRRLAENGAYEDEELPDEDAVRARLSDDWEETLKINKEERKFPRHHVRRLAQIGLSADERFDQAKRMREEAERERAALKENPLDVLAELDDYKLSESFDGLSITKSEALALKIAADVYRMKQLRDNRDNPLSISEYMRIERERNDRLRSAAEKATERKRQQEEVQRQREIFMQRMEPELKSAMKTAQIRDTKANRERIIAHMRQAKSRGYEVSLIDAAHFAREESLAELRAEFEGVDGPSAMAKLGPAVLKLIREAEVKRVEASQQQTAEPQQKREPSMSQIAKAAMKEATAAARGKSVVAFSRPR